MDRLHVRRLRLPDRGARGDDPARGAVRGLPGRARDPDRQARRRPRDRAAVRRRARATTSARRTATTSRSSRAGRTTSRSSATPAHKVYGVGKIGDIFAGCDIDESLPDEVERRRDRADRAAAARARRRARLHEPRRDRHALGPPQRPGQLPPLPAGLRPAAGGHARRAAPGRPARSSRPTTAATRRRRRPTTRASTRCCSPTSRAGTRRAGPRGRVRRRRRDRERLARRQGARLAASRASRSSTP